jgi:hypothetical protein
MAAFATSVQKISPLWWKTASIPSKNTIKKFKKRVKILKNPNRIPPLKICESVQLTKYFFYFAILKKIKKGHQV